MGMANLPRGGGGGGGGGALAGQMCTDARTKDRKTYPKYCVRHFEIDTPFQCVQSKKFQCSKLKRLLSSATFCKIIFYILYFYIVYIFLLVL